MTLVFIALVMALCYPLALWSHSKWGDRWWTIVFALIASPLFLLHLLLMASWMVPYAYLYPERQACFVDFRGSDEHKQTLKRYREEAARRTFFRRVVEAARLRPYSGPAWPKEFDDIPEPTSTGSQLTHDPSKSAN